MKNTFLLYLFLLFTTSLPAQQKEFILKNFTQEEGLPSNETYYVFEDSKHYIWIATDLGVVRYDGNKFEKFSLPDDVVFRIKEDKKGRIWFFTQKAQLAYFYNEKIHLYKYNADILARIKKIHIKDVVIDDEDNIFLSSTTDSNYTIKADGSITGTNHYKKSPVSALHIDILENNTCFTKISAQYGESYSFVIVITDKTQQRKYTIPFHHIGSSQFGSITLNGRDVYFFYGYFLAKLNADGTYIVRQMPAVVLSMRHSQDGLWIGMQKGGAVLLNSDLSEKNNSVALQGKSISSITVDYENGMWFSTLEKGLYYVKNRSVKHLLIPNQQETAISRIHNVKDSMLVYSNSNGFYKLMGNRNELLLRMDNTNISTLFSRGDDTLMATGGFSDFYSKIIRQPNTSRVFYLMNSSSSEALWIKDLVIISTANGTVKFKSSFIDIKNFTNSKDSSVIPPKQLLNVPAKLYLDSNKNIWAGTNDGLYKSIFPYDSLISFKNNATALFKKGVSCIQQGPGGMIAAGVRSGGIVILNDTGVITSITENSGLSTNKIRCLCSFKNQLWAATAKDISIIEFTSYNPLKYTISTIDKSDGFYNITINQLLQYRNNIVAATSNGLYFIEEPTIFLNRNLPSIPFHISSVTYFKGDTTGIVSISLPYSKNRLVIKYKAISFNSFENIQYHYRFDHRDTTWHTTSVTELLLENLEPGTYHLEIKAVIPSQQRSSQIQTFSIVVDKPWWQNNWLRLLSVLLISAGIYLYVKRRIKKIQAEEKRKTELNAKLTELEQTALRSQMNPHFIFNCLTSIQQLIISGNKTDANEYLVKFSRLIRKTLEMSAQPFISIREEKEYLEEYLFLEQLRLSGKFEYHIITDASINIDQTLIPNMMIQPVVENCVRHGIKSLENRKGIINVIFKPNQKTIRCSVRDNGSGRDNISSFNEKAFTKHKSYGMDIVCKRLETFSEFNVDESGIEIKDLFDDKGQPAGTEVTLHLPFKKL